jgi:hypothetical protein
MKDITTQRPKGLVPGTPEWLAQVQGPKLVLRMIAEIDAQPVGGMSPTGARLLGMALDRILPSLTAIHHSGDTPLTGFTDDQLREKLRVLLGQEEATKFDLNTIDTVEFKEQSAGE